MQNVVLFAGLIEVQRSWDELLVQTSTPASSRVLRVIRPRGSGRAPPLVRTKNLAPSRTLSTHIWKRDTNKGEQYVFVHPKALTVYISLAATVEAVIGAYSTHANSLNAIHLGACWTSMGRFARTGLIDRNWLLANSKYLQPLLQHTVRVVISESLSEILLGACWTSMGWFARKGLIDRNWLLANSKYLQSPLQHTVRVVAAGNFSARLLANVAHAATLTRGIDPEGTLFTALAIEVQQRADELNQQDIANIVWAFAKARQLGYPVWEALATEAMRQAAETQFKPQHVAITAWAFATVGWPSGPLYVALGESCCFSKCGAQDLANMAWAFATAHVHDMHVFGLLAGASKRRIHKFTSQGLANLAWAFVKVRRLDAPLFRALPRLVDKCISKFNARDLANIAWAFTTTGVHYGTLNWPKLGHPTPWESLPFTALASVADRCTDEFDTARHSNHSLFDTLANAMEQRIDELNAQELCNTAWAFAMSGRSDAPLFAALARTLQLHMNGLSTQCLANLAWSFAAANFYPGTQFGLAFAARCEAVDWSGPQLKAELSQLYLWALWHQEELYIQPPLSPALLNRCRGAFCSNKCVPSRIQLEVAASLGELGIYVEEAVSTTEGYIVDLLVTWLDQEIIMEVKGPGHFLGAEHRLAHGGTLMKHRQLRAMGWSLILVPYWEWNLQKDSTERCRYLWRLLNEAYDGVSV